MNIDKETESEMTNVLYITEIDAAKRLGLARSTLARWRGIGDGPKFHKFGSAVRYSIADLERYTDAGKASQ